MIIPVMILFLIVTQVAADGDLTDWTQATGWAAFSGREGHTSVVYDDKMWVLGGLNVARFGQQLYLNDVWYSTNGTTWIQATSAAGFSKRRSHASVVYDGKIWVIGGLNEYYGSLNDVWYSTNGVNWIRAVGPAAFSPRRGHTSVGYDNRMWVIGGLNLGINTFNDVWYSKNGVNWIRTTGSAAFSPRSGHTSVVYGGKMWVIGGHMGGTYKNDVWYSTDGTTWIRTTGSAAFSPRSGHTSVVYDGKMWVIGGYNGSYLNDVWYSTDGETWTEATSSPAFSGRRDHTSVLYDDKVWVISGYNGNYLNDVWYSDGWIASTVIIDNGSISGPGGETTVTLTLDNAPNGLSEYYLEVSLENSSIAEITGVVFPGWAVGMNRNGTLPATRDLMIWANDTTYTVDSGALNVTLVTLTLEGLNPGSTTINISNTNFDDDDGNDILPSVITGTLTVDYIPTLINVTPASGYNNASVNVTLAGTGFMSGTTVNLTRPGSVITGTNFSYVSETQIDCVFNITGQAEGTWNVTVINPDGKTATLTDGFTIVVPLVPVDGIMPADPDGDGKYEDLNGNGQADYADVNIFFVSYSWIEENEPAEAFDFNNNGRLDMADIVALFDSIS